MTGLTVETKDGICWLTLNRPEQRNALDRPLLDALSDSFDQVGSDDEIRCLVITGQGRGFCAGADVAEWAEAEARGELETYGWSEKAHAMMLKLHHLAKPTIAAINGTIVGAGLDMALSCDFRYSANSAKFIAGYTGMGYSPDAGASWHLPRLIGLEAAKEFLFFDTPWTAEQAADNGMVTDIYAPDELLGEVRLKAERLAQAPTFAIGQTKTLLDQSSRTSLAEQLSLELQAALLCGRTEDADEAIRAVTEKRRPKFTGR